MKCRLLLRLLLNSWFNQMQIWSSRMHLRKGRTWRKRCRAQWCSWRSWTGKTTTFHCKALECTQLEHFIAIKWINQSIELTTGVGVEEETKTILIGHRRLVRAHRCGVDHRNDSHNQDDTHLQCIKKISKKWQEMRIKVDVKFLQCWSETWWLIYWEKIDLLGRVESEFLVVQVP